MKANFQLIVLIVFIAAAIFGVLVFSGAIPIGGNGTSSPSTIVLWGTVPTLSISSALKDFNDANPSFVVKYVQKSSDTFDQDLLEALASGTGPDMFFLPNDLAYHYTNKIFTIPYASYPISVFNSIFASAGQVFLTDNGVLALPISIDPLMMYYSRSLFDANGVVYPPATWDDLTAMAPTLTEKDESGKIIKSAVDLGDFSNVVHAKDILATLFMQAGNPIIKDDNGVFSSTLDSSVGNYNLPSVLQFFTSFADPSNTAYSWNESFPDSTDAFSAENLAIYFGYASELQSLVNKNPNQNFFVAGIPQIKNSSFKLTNAQVTGIAISSSSKNISTAFAAANLMVSGDFASAFASAIGAVPARRDLLATKPADAFSPFFYSSALYAKSWLDPSPTDTNNIFSVMVGNVLSGNMDTTGAISDASSKMSLLLLK